MGIEASKMRWSTRESPEPKVLDQLMTDIRVDAITSTLLWQRGITSFDHAKEFFNPSLDLLHDPFLMADMDKAVNRLSEAISKGEKIMIYGDYDVDGTTAVSLVYGFLQQFEVSLMHYIPDRYAEGYGISYKGVKFAAEQGVSLVISLDCGVKDADKIAYAKELGLEFIVCDHHTLGDEVHPAYALLNPKRPDCEYPYKELSGCGVGFKLMQGFCRQQCIEEDRLFEYLDLLCISIGADIVPITGENRILAYWGLHRINQSPRPGIEALTLVAEFKKELNISNVVFGLAPRINAAGRIAHGNLAVQLLLSKNKEEAQSFAMEINGLNVSRRTFDSDITAEALEMIRSNTLWEEAVSTVLYKEDWHKGVVGIVASRCIEHYFRPTIILTQNQGLATGSARSVPGFDVYEAIAACSELLEQFGGHQHAAGLSLKPDKIEEFRARFDQEVKQRITSDLLIPRLWIDLWIHPEDITERLYRIVQRMSPFGPGNMQPVFALKGVLPTQPQLLKESHIKFKLVRPNLSTLDVIGFGMAESFEWLGGDKQLDLAFQIQLNEFNGKQSLQLQLKALRLSSDKT